MWAAQKADSAAARLATAIDIAVVTLVLITAVLATLLLHRGV